MSPNYGFPSETAPERKYLRNNTRESKDLFGWFLFFIAVLSLLLMGMITEKLAIDPFIRTVHASEPEVIHQNNWYCEHIKNGYYPTIVGSSTPSALQDLCAKWGVDI